MKASEMRVKPYKGKFVFRKRANRVNDMFLSAVTPDRTKLIQEAKEFEELIKQRRSMKVK